MGGRAMTEMYEDFVYKKYWNESKNHFIEEI